MNDRLSYVTIRFTLLVQKSLYSIYILLYLINSLINKKKRKYILFPSGEEAELIGKEQFNVQESLNLSYQFLEFHLKLNFHEKADGRLALAAAAPAKKGGWLIEIRSRSLVTVYEDSSSP